MTFDSSEGELGIENRGLNRWSLHFAKGKSYEGILWESGDGSRTLAETKLTVDRTGFAPRSSKAIIVTLQGSMNSANTAEQPGAIVPAQQEWPHGVANGEAKYVFAARSVTVIRFE